MTLFLTFKNIRATRSGRTIEFRYRENETQISACSRHLILSMMVSFSYADIFECC